ncbi:HRQ family 2 [Pyrenophora seminiperda CCB06]|uniref:HRQ family 2 n=1 Tax=Pyrenophora seminiperda CCB06 TaxID=1302712 RepID=A0A3M7MEJ3_9PLEO|nr:HRQ family 2 [Pyrenophora seminiperda CCB06]
MALQNIPISSLLELDNTYAARLTQRRARLASNRREVLAATPEGKEAVLEFYQWVVSVYLVGRWPGIYRYTDMGADSGGVGKEGGGGKGKGVRNSITGEILPLDIYDAELALELLNGNIDTEFLFLLSSPSTPSTQPTYKLASYINATPAGFSTRSKLHLSLSAIHNPVPYYAEKLERSMDRFFARLPVGKVVKRENWSVSVKGEWFCLEGAHGVVHANTNTNNDAKEQEQEKMKEEEEVVVDPEITSLRCERQTLHRLPVSGAVVFAFKTYMYPVRLIRDEGSGEALAEAIDGLGLGSVPDMRFYKRGDVWGEEVKAFLRGEGGRRGELGVDEE